MSFSDTFRKFVEKAKDVVEFADDTLDVASAVVPADSETKTELKVDVFAAAGRALEAWDLENVPDDVEELLDQAAVLILKAGALMGRKYLDKAADAPTV